MAALLFSSAVAAFQAPTGIITGTFRPATAASPSLASARMGLEELEFVIHPDGRVEERVKGVKGANCQELTAKLEAALGKVYHSEVTEEYYEQKVEVTNTNEISQTWGQSGKADVYNAESEW